MNRLYCQRPSKRHFKSLPQPSTHFTVAKWIFKLSLLDQLDLPRCTHTTLYMINQGPPCSVCCLAHAWCVAFTLLLTMMITTYVVFVEKRVGTRGFIFDVTVKRNVRMDLNRDSTRDSTRPIFLSSSAISSSAATTTSIASISQSSHQTTVYQHRYRTVATAKKRQHCTVLKLYTTCRQ